MGEAKFSPVQPQNSREERLKTRRGDYLIQISWPHAWRISGEEADPANQKSDVPIMC